jgi:cytochrome c biogenesis protein CcdA
VFTASLWVAWSAMRGSYDGATTWQVVCSRAVSELSQSPIAFGSVGSRYALETIAVLLGFVVVFWPGAISAGMMSAALALLSRPGVDVPAAALVLATSALIAPLSRAPVVDRAPATTPPRHGRTEQTPAGADP